VTTLARHEVGRAALWRLLSLGFAPPTAATRAEVEALAQALVETGAPLEVEEHLAALRSSSPQDVAAEYQTLFGGRVAVSPYEGSYELDPLRQGRQLADVSGFYLAFGAEPHGPAAERPDHLGCELEFLALLELERVALAERGEEGDARFVDEIESSFLGDHAGRWLPTFFAEVRVAAPEGSPFRPLAALGERLVAEELDRRELSPLPLPRRRSRAAVEHDAFECGSAA